MGKKATLLYFHSIAVLLTAALAIFTIIVGIGSRSNPNEEFLLPILGLGIIPLLISNLLIMLYWAIRWKIWILVPVIAITANYEFISAKYQFPYKELPPMVNSKLIRIASFNVQSFHGDPSVYSVGEVAELMKEKQVDVFCLQEFSTSSLFSVDSISSVFKDYPYVAIKKNNIPGFGVVIYSKFPIENEADISFSSSNNSAMWADIKIGNAPIRIFNCHLQTTNFNQTKGLLKKITVAGFYDSKKEAVREIIYKMSENAKKRANQVDLLYQIIDTTKHAIIVCGDFNDTPTSYTYYRMKEKLEDGFQSAGSGFESTFRYLHRFLRIDYIFHSKELTGRKYSTPSFDFSDHNPVIMELSVKKE